MDFLSALLNIPVYALNAGISAIILGIVSGALGSFIVLRKMSLMGDALSHAVLPGVALSYILGINILLGASLFGLLAAILIQFITSRSNIKSDTSIGIILSSFFALGIVLITYAKSGLDLTHILFGNILAIPQSELTRSFMIMIVVIVIIILLYKELLISSFDPIVSKAYGLRTGFYHYLLMMLLSVVTVSSLSQVGIVLVIAMLVIPAATSYLWTNKLSHMIYLASAVGALSGIVGVFVSFRFNLPTSATIVLVGVSMFSISFILSPKNNFLRKGLK
ncbi:iron chelate uptake ABC transporter family permease subunit [Paenibacillus wynnii]|uniref:iron chelate uptake ABC transporter family permease subunit n=1 Tax=Paenibacillus wynnii TaxID=268407 RepID=UPI003B833F83